MSSMTMAGTGFSIGTTSLRSTLSSHRCRPKNGSSRPSAVHSKESGLLEYLTAKAKRCDGLRIMTDFCINATWRQALSMAAHDRSRLRKFYAGQ